MKKRFMLIMMLGISFAPPAMAEGPASTGEKKLVKSYAADSIQCAKRGAKSLRGDSDAAKPVVRGGRAGSTEKI